MEGRATLRRAGRVMLGAVIVLSVAPPAIAQTVVIRGRVEDAVSRRPLAEVTVFSSDSATTALTDSSGSFALRVSSAHPITLLAERTGYLPDRFDLPESAPFRTAVLLLEPEPIQLEGIRVVGESAVKEVTGDLARRRNAYPKSVSAFDQTQLKRLGRIGSVWDFVRRRAFRVYECNISLSGLCAREGRGNQSVLLTSEIQVRVCIDGNETWGAVAELRSLDIGSVSLVEIYRDGRDGIHVYTPEYITTTARTGRRIATPVEYGC